KSPRAVTPAQASELIAQMQQRNIGLNMVGVFVNHPVADIASLAQTLNLFAVQLHGNETELEITELKALLKQQQLNTEIWKAVAISSNNGEVSQKPAGADRYLYD
ncbi:MAG TPA: bifunctional indole-3-glycerol phosphate synthase/phosphoribosylanthranilate isomerase, partial [Shewanella frigidimarina]|nr:bifunctional indole-3-glycerol phosphate synthase/phosphoribosylanthranilate isomerase [Shewanella frigidimarina]